MSGAMATGAPPQFYPVYLDLRDRPCLVVGGGLIAESKARGFLEAGARVTVVAPEANPQIGAWAAAGRLSWMRRAFQDEDVRGAFLVVAATDDRHLNAAIYRRADGAGCVANAVDDLDHCNFIAAAVARAGAVQVAVSTAGQSPALAKRLRDQIARDVLTPPVAALSAFLGAWRPRVKQALEGYERRQRFWEGVLEGCIPGLVAECHLAQAERAMAECLHRSRTADAFATCAAHPTRPAACGACRGAAS